MTNRPPRPLAVRVGALRAARILLRNYASREGCTALVSPVRSTMTGSAGRIWHRVADDVAVAWAGNDVDLDGTWSVLDVPVPRGTLIDYVTGPPLGPATAAQQTTSRSAGDAGVILVDGDGDVVEAGTWGAQQAGVRRVFVA